MNQKKVRWGIISTARIAETAFIPALRQTERGELVAVASRSQASADAFAQKHEIPRAFAGYEALLASDEIDAIYNPLPNTLHAEWTKAAARHGKHIFCEKPLAMSPAEAQQMIEACEAAGVLLVEAFVFLLHPQTLNLRRLLDDGAIGNLLQLQARLTFHLDRPTDNIRLNKELGGGGLLDAGCYPITFARFAFGAEPVAVQAAVHMDPEYGVDSRVAMLLTFPGDGFATLHTGVDAIGGPGAVLMGDKGYIEIPQPYHPRGESHFTVHTAAGAETVSFNTGKLPFTAAIEQFHDCLLDGAQPLVPASNAIGTARVIDAVFESARLGQRINLHET
ncbi:MAG: Gfo/Idh/MocA family oxidoreductase [Caldilineaceae bacterium]